MKLAIVIPWFGRELKGGAEQHAWQIATRLAQRGHDLDVVTTCCRSHQDDWSINHLPSGVTDEPEGFTVRRFEVDPRDRVAFDRVCAHLLSIPSDTLKPGVSPVDDHDANIFASELIRSQSLLDYLSAQRENYDGFILLPYLYGPVLYGVSILQNHAVLQPCLHNEAYAYLPQISRAFYIAGRLFFISEGERELALRLFGPGIWNKSHVVGGGIETDSNTGWTAGNDSSTAAGGRFVLYLGRKAVDKNVPLLLRSFRQFKAVRPNSDLKLIVAGHGVIDTNGCDSIIDVGLVSESEKTDLLKKCVALVQPSKNESFSRVIMEAWRHGRPVAVHASCLATATAVRRCGGGWIAENEDDWAEVFTRIDRMSSNDLAELGDNGQRYVHEIADWERVIDRYEEALAEFAIEGKATAERPSNKCAIHQVLPHMSYGDAISSQALFIRDTLRRQGCISNIYVSCCDLRIQNECRLFSTECIEKSTAIIYHHSVGSELTPHLVRHLGPKFLIYHNITPPEFFEPYSPDYAKALRAGRDELDELAPRFPFSAADSAYNVEELTAHGFTNPMVLPIAVDPARWAMSPDPELMKQFQDGRTNVLFAGRLAPNKRQDDLIHAFAEYLNFDPAARLILVGPFQENDPYVASLREIIEWNGLEQSVILPGSVHDAELAAYYRTADLFWSMSEHEGFGVPLVEAMWFDVPVLAFKTAAVAETLGRAALMFNDKMDFRSLAALAFLLVKDSELRHRVLKAQRQNRLRFLPDLVRERVIAVVDQMLASRESASDFSIIDGSVNTLSRLYSSTIAD